MPPDVNIVPDTGQRDLTFLSDFISVRTSRVESKDRLICVLLSVKQIIHESFIMRFLSILCLTMIVGWPFQANSQVTTTVDCDLMGLVVNVGSDSNSVNLYHPGGYLTWPPAYNVMNWEFTDSEGNLIHEATTQDENFIHVVHNLPVTDTLFVSVLLTNDSALHNGVPVACLIEDYLFWEVDTWPNSGEEYGTWTLGGSVGQDVSETTGLNFVLPEWPLLELFPQPASDKLVVKGLRGMGTLMVLDMNGKILQQQTILTSQEEIDVQPLPVGQYLLQWIDRGGLPQQSQMFLVAK